MKRFLFSLITILISVSCIAQFDSWEDNVQWYSDIMKHAKYAEHRAYAASQIKDLVLGKLIADQEFKAELDSVESMSLLYSEDRDFRIFTMQKLNQQMEGQFSGFVQFKRGEVIPLKSSSAAAISESRYLPAGRWPGAVYEKLIEHKIDGKSYYILIGSAFESERSWRHITEVFHMDNGMLKIGAPLFYHPEEDYSKYRISRSFMAGSGSTMHYIPKSDQIVMDHLTTISDPRTGAQRQVPDGTYEVYKRKKDQWLYVEKANSPLEKELKTGNTNPHKSNRDIFGRQRDN